MVNAATARLVDLIGRVLATGSWEGWQIRSPEHWSRGGAGSHPPGPGPWCPWPAGWRVPQTKAAFDGGELSPDQAAVPVSSRRRRYSSIVPAPAVVFISEKLGGAAPPAAATLSAVDDLAAWDRIAATYSQRTGDGDDSISTRFAPFLDRHLGGDLTRLSVLDLGCGHGWLAERCRRRGADVLALDGSAELLAIGRARYPDVRFEHADLTVGLPPSVTSRTFDRIVAHMVLMDLPALDRLGAALAPCLAEGASLIATLPHPSFFNRSPAEDPDTGERYRKVTGYLDHEEWWIPTFGGHRHYHRPLGFYVNWLASIGLAVVELDEPPTPVPEPVTDHDGWFATVPTMIGLAARRLPPPRRTTLS